MTAAEEPVYLDKWAIYDTVIDYDVEKQRDVLVWDPHPGQLVIEESCARHQVASCGRRFGKSFLGGKRLVPWAFVAYHRRHYLKRIGKRMEYWIVGPEYSDSEKEFRVLYNTLEALGVPFDRPGTYNDPIGGSMHISLWGGAYQVHAKSAKYPDTLVGEGLHGVILAEAAKQKPSIWVKYIRPMLNDHKGWSLHTSTPEGKNHFYDKFEDGQDPNNPEWESWRMPSWVNPEVHTTPTVDAHVSYLQTLMRENPEKTSWWLASKHNLQIDSEILDLMNDMSPEAFNQEIGADFTEYVGKVFKDWDEAYHVDDLEFNPTWETYAAVDYGFTNPNVWLIIQVGPWDEINVLSEIYETNMTAEMLAEEIKRRRRRPANLIKFFPDPASPEDSQVLSDRLGVRSAGGTGGEKRVRLDLIRNALRRGRTDGRDPQGTNWRPQLMVDRSCIHMRREMEAYRYPDSKDKPNPSSLIYEEPLKKDDHTPEALGRFMIGYFGARALIQEGVQGGARVSKMGVDMMGRGTGRRTRNAPPPPKVLPARYQELMPHEPEAYQYKRGLWRPEDE